MIRRDRPLRRAVALVLMLRVALGLLAWAAVQLVPPPSIGGDWTQLRVPASAWWSAMVEPWQRWDALWYQHLATVWYSPHSGDAAFLPLYPAIVHGVAVVIGDNFAVAALVVSTAALVVALVLLRRLVAHDVDAATADRAVLYTALAPTAFFFFAGYSESLFLVLTLAAVVSARRRHWYGAGASGFLASLCRPTGVLIAIPLIVEAVTDAGSKHREGHRWLRPVHIMALAPLLGLAAYTVFASTVLHSPGGSFGAASAGWGQHPAWPWTSVVDGVRAAPAHPEEWLNLAATALLIAAVPLMWRRLPLSYTLYAAAMIPVLCFRSAYLTPLMSADRYLLAAFPVVVLLAMAGRRPWLHRTIVGISSLLLAVLTVAFAEGAFLG